MSRLTEIIDNHRRLDELFSLIRHYGMSAEFVTDGLIQQLQQIQDADEDEDEENSEADKEYATDMLNDLKQFYSTF
jgi:hypothetical protein